MVRSIACALAVALLAGGLSADDKPARAAQNNQMVRGTVKSADPAKSVLVIDQKVKKETVQRELDIRDTTEFEVTIDGAKKKVTGKEGLVLLEGKAGGRVTVKCDKDVNVLKVTATVKK